MYSLVLARTDSGVFSEIVSIPNWQELRIGRVYFRQREWSVLHLAVWKGNVQLVQQLLQVGADGTRTDFYGDTPGDLARELDDLEMQELLGPLSAEKAGIEKQTNSTLDGDLKLHSAVFHSSLGNSQSNAVQSFKGGKDSAAQSVNKIRPE